MTRAALALVAAGLIAAAAGEAGAQRRAPGGFDPLLAPAASPPAPPALDAAQLRRFAEARAHRQAGRVERARVMLQALLAERPHHPGVLDELIALHAAREDWGAIERLARAERRALADSVAHARVLAHALGQQRRVREAAQVAVEAWVASPAEQEWAAGLLERAEGEGGRPVREALRRAAEKRPHRSDLARGAARLEARAGDVTPALRALGAADRAEGRWRLRWSLAEELVAGAAATADTAAAGEILLDLAADDAADPGFRASAAQRYWELAAVGGAAGGNAGRVRRALDDIPPARWNPRLRLEVARELRRAGRTTEVRELLADPGTGGVASDLELERALAELRDGPPAVALPRLAALAPAGAEATFRYAEALFFAGHTDSAHAWYTRAAADPAAPFAGAALERLYLLEEPTAAAALPAFGRIAYAEWRGDGARFQSLSDSLYRALPRGAAWAQAALLASSARASDARAALLPLLAVADSLPGDRLAPLARQRAGDLYRTRLGDEAAAIRQYEECLTRYPRAWNAAEVRRRLEQLKRGARKAS